MLYSFLHPVDFAQYLADKHDQSILSIAPGEGNKPEKVLELEAKCFPAEFPDLLHNTSTHGFFQQTIDLQEILNTYFLLCMLQKFIKLVPIFLLL